MRIFFVAPDYHEGKAKKCVNGWGSMFLTVAPDGTAMPCHTAKMLPGLAFPNVREHSMREIWFESEGFNRYRGTGWMKEPCSSCEHREEDLGGCRCQAYLIAQDAAAADPVCRLSPHHQRVVDVVERAETAAATRVTEHPLVFRDPAEFAPARQTPAPDTGCAARATVPGAGFPAARRRSRRCRCPRASASAA